MNLQQFKSTIENASGNKHLIKQTAKLNDSQKYEALVNFNTFVDVKDLNDFEVHKIEVKNSVVRIIFKYTGE